MMLNRTILGLIVLFSPKIFAQSSLPACTMNMLCQQFQSQKNQVYFYDDGHRKVPNFGFLKSVRGQLAEFQHDPFLNPKLFAKKEFQKTYEDAEKNIARIFEETKADVVEVLRRKRPALSQQNFFNLSQRINTVKLASLEDPEIQNIAREACTRPNAIYMDRSHQMLVCPSIMNFPEMTLQKVLSHELGHAIDPCTISYDLSLYKGPGFEVSLNGIGYQKTAMADTVQCLQSKDSIHSYDSLKVRSQHSACALVSPNSQIQEAFADWVASEVVAEKIRQEQNQKLAQQKALESQLLFLSVACFSDQKEEAKVTRSHPSIQKRIERIFLAQVSLQNAFQCKAEGVKHCE